MLISKFKSILSLLIVLCLCLTMLSACGNNDNVGNISSNDEVAESTSSDDKKIGIASATVGSSVFFGTYEQDNNTSNGAEDIEWIVLENDSDKMMLISKYVLDGKDYNDEYGEFTWETCGLRTWLNEVFLTTAFNENEKMAVCETLISNPDNATWGTEGGNDTTDKVFLLSIDEVNKYFPTEESHFATGTVYGNTIMTKDSGSEHRFWWLRSPGKVSANAAYIHADGRLVDVGMTVNVMCFGVRPVIYVKIAK